MNAPIRRPNAFAPRHEFFVGFDSDGCVFDTMDLKHRECFVPMLVKHFSLQPVARLARETWEWVNLHSKTRGINRYPALSNVLDLLARRPELQNREVHVPGTEELDDWLARTPHHTLDALRAEVEQRGNAALEPVLQWSVAVDAAIADIVHGVPPFPGVRETLARLQESADTGVISQTPVDALEREWAEHDLARFVALVSGQEMGSKREQLQMATSGRYPANHVLLVGDAPVDFTAAKSNHALFYPILPGREEASWRRLLDEVIEAFLAGSYAGDFEAELTREFTACLPELPSW